MRDSCIIPTRPAARACAADAPADVFRADARAARGVVRVLRAAVQQGRGPRHPDSVLDEDHTSLSRKVTQMIDDTATAMVSYGIQDMDEGES